MDNKHKLFWALLFLAGFSLCPLFLCDIAKATTLHYEDIVINVYGNAQYNKNVELRSWDDTTATDYYDTTDSDGKWSLTIEAGEYGVWVDSVYEGRFIATPDLMTDVVIGKTKGDTIKFKGTVVIDSAITFTTAVPDSAKKCQHADTAAYTSTVADSTRASRKADSAYTWAAYADSADGANLIDGINGAALMLKADMDDSTARFMLKADMDDSVSSIVTDSLANYLLLANLGDSITAHAKDSIGAVVTDSLANYLLLTNLGDSITAHAKDSIGAVVTDSLANYLLLANLGDSITAHAKDSIGAVVTDSLAFYLLRAALDDSIAAHAKDSIGAVVTDSLANYLLLANLGDSITAHAKDSIGAVVTDSLANYLLRVALKDSIAAHTQDSVADSTEGAVRLAGLAGTYYLLKSQVGDSITAHAKDSIGAVVTDSLANYLLLANLGDSITAHAKDSIGAVVTDSLANYLLLANLGDSITAHSKDSIGAVVTDSLANYTLLSVLGDSIAAHTQDSVADSATAALKSDSTYNIVADLTPILGGNLDVNAKQFTAGVNRLMEYTSTSLYFGPSVGDSGDNNTFVGKNSGLVNAAGGNDNAFFGYQTGTANTTGDNNSGFGSGALQNNTTGGNNTSIGYNSGFTISTGSYNTHIGAATTGGAATNSSIALGYLAATNTDHQMVIGGNSAVGYVDTIYIGRGTSSTTANDLYLKPTDASGTNVTGNTFNIGSGRGTGTGAGGDILLKISKMGASGTTMRDWVQIAKFDTTGLVMNTEHITGIDSIFSTKAEFDTILSTYLKNLSGWVDSAVTCDTATTALYADTTDGASYVMGLQPGTSGDSLAVTSGANTWSAAQTFSGIITCSDSIKGTDIRLTGVYLSSADTVMVGSNDDLTIHGILTVRESLYVTEGVKFNTILVVDDSLTSSGGTYGKRAELDSLRGDTLNYNDGHFEHLSADTVHGDSIDFNDANLTDIYTTNIKNDGTGKGIAIACSVLSVDSVLQMEACATVPTNLSNGQIWWTSNGNDSLYIYLNGKQVFLGSGD